MTRLTDLTSSAGSDAVAEGGLAGPSELSDDDRLEESEGSEENEVAGEEAGVVKEADWTILNSSNAGSNATTTEGVGVGRCLAARKQAIES